MGKHCTRCEQWKPLDDFHRNRAARDGRRQVCKPCAAGTTRNWRRENPEKLHHWEDTHRDRRNARKREQHHQAGAERLDQMRQWRTRNPATHKAATQRWEANHRGQRVAYLRARQLHRRRSMLRGLAWRDFQPIYDRAAALSRDTGIPHHVDHIVPLKHPLVCGLHVPANLQILPAHENLAKHNKFNVLVLSRPD